ncbi:O-antigen ligase family protein [Acetivibrio mesophilus]|uniref:Polymerase n=1 Tax=Acetivibrio mesophilus TaxID=2487273 RepID=A0A4V1K289_9FIRM|nr:O-antigen ligase family protein [Acetivibrio mesophilus]RXE59449.1 polymerase [Acetivibrio mesophilus]HHV30240.1 polymerase [Clostridium sp.]
MLHNSVLLKPIIFMIQVINTSYESSILKKVVTSIINFFRKLNHFYENSFTAYIAKSITGLLYNSAIIGFFTRKGKMARWWEHSLAYRIINGCFEVPSRILKGFYQKYEAVFLESAVIRALKFLLQRLECIVGLFLIVILVVPHERWNNIYNVAIALFLVFLIFINTIIQRYWMFNFKALDYTLILFMTAVVVSFATSMNISSSIKYLLFYVAGFLFVLVIVSTVKNENSLQTIIEMMLFGITVIGSYGLWQSISGAVVFDPSLTDVGMNQGMPGRIYATMSNPNNFGEILIMALPFYVSVILNSKTFFKKVVYIVMALPPLVALFNTGSRSSWIGFAVSVIVITFLINKRLLPFILLGGVMMIPFLPQYVYNRILTIFRASQDTSAQTRIKILQTVKPMLKTYMVSGVGLGSDIFRQLIQNYKLYTKAVPPHTHILYLQIWIEIGLAGFATFIWYIYRTIKNSVIGVYNSTPTLKTILAAGTAALSGILVTSLVEYSWYYPRVMVMFWVLLGIIASAISLAELKNRKLSEMD